MPPAEFHAPDATPHPPEPTRWSALVFRFKALCFQSQRVLTDCLHPVKRFSKGDKLCDAEVVTAWSSDLWRGGESPRERHLQLGKVQNLRIAAQMLDGLEIPADEVWSFWKHLGRTTRQKGYANGRELREGCLIPQTGGGLCQLSGAIYNAALEAGLDIVERHAHSNASIGSLAKIGRDATIFWNYVDLRLKHSCAWRLEVYLSQDQLHINIRSREKVSKPLPVPDKPTDGLPLNACATCGLTSCHRSTPLDNAQAHVDRSAVLADAWWPEWDAFFQQENAAQRDLFLPLDGERWGKPNYQWNKAIHATARSFTWLTLRRAWATRRLRNEGARRQSTMLQWDEKLAAAYGHALKAHHAHLFISQNLLPHLWREGWLGGRTFDVLMTRLPLYALHEHLDMAATRYPESSTCADFRAEDLLVHHEKEALAAASRWITPHAAIAKLGGNKACLQPWFLPTKPSSSQQSNKVKTILFPASTLCRKGAFELREAVRRLPVQIELRGGVLEGADFWTGVTLRSSDAGFMDRADVVVLPAFVEHCPRMLLEAIARGIPVIASEACGLEGMPGVTVIPTGDENALRAALEQQLHLASVTTFR